MSGGPEVEVYWRWMLGLCVAGLFLMVVMIPFLAWLKFNG